MGIRILGGIMKLTAEQIQENWDELIQIVEDTFEGERKELLLKMYGDFKDRGMFAPASGTDYFHNAWPGGYVHHILHIIDLSMKLYNVWKENGAFTEDYGKEEVIFCAMHHDLGKLGDLEQDYYEPNDSEWHRINQGKMYKENQNLHYMTVTDRAVWILSQYGIKMSQVEYLALRLTDGMYEDANKGYLKAYAENHQLKSNLPLILHQADMMATRLEKEAYMFGDNPNIPYGEIISPKVKEETEQKEKELVENVKKEFGTFPQTETPEISSTQTAKDLFNELFGDTP